ncbi:hypothetical protein IU459_31795 [Nocardia amamiensis]|uniref:Uncharacterized protein n=1 Tax=Nocardia amamiensis TaxID=404578 RepID=A0ABS0CZR5_9NOCA|nr:hypothetical protein [Nocardia amamiensis]MBF6302093.1 hypothetical protein [Nocardia amamiensis]
MFDPFANTRPAGVTAMTERLKCTDEPVKSPIETGPGRIDLHPRSLELTRDRDQARKRRATNLGIEHRA